MKSKMVEIFAYHLWLKEVKEELIKQNIINDQEGLDEVAWRPYFDEGLTSHEAANIDIQNLLL